MEKVLVVLVVLMILAYPGLYILGHRNGSRGESARSDELRKELEVERNRRQTAEKDVLRLTPEIERLRTQLAGGLDIGEERKALERRESELKRGQELLQTETAALNVQKDEFYKSRNTTEQQYGRAMHALEEYDNMRRERNVALAAKETGLWVFFSTLAASVAVIFLLIMRLFKHRERVEGGSAMVALLQQNPQIAGAVRSYQDKSLPPPQ